MAEEEDKAARYDVVYNRVKVYIPFLQELISFYKNDSHQNRQQQLQKIITIYDLLTNQRLNYLSLCKCEKVLIKLYETNPLRKPREPSTKDEVGSTTTNQSIEDKPASPADPDAQPRSDLLLERRTEEDNPIASNSQADPGTSKKPAPSFELDSPAESCASAEPDSPAESDCLAHADSILEPISPPPLSLDEITRLITSDSKPEGSKSSSNNLAKLINDALKVFQRPTFDEHARNPSPPYENSQHGRNLNVPYSPTYPTEISTNHGADWEAEGDAFDVFPHSSRRLHRRRDDIKYFHDDGMDISPTHSSPSDNRAPSGAAPPVNLEERRIRKAVESSMHVHSPNPLGPDKPNPFFPTMKANDPRLNRANIPIPPAPTPNELPRCVAPNPNLPLDLPKKDPPKRRLSICANQVIIEKIPPEPVLLPPRSFPARRQSICGDFNINRNNEPFRGSSFLPAPVPPPFPPASFPMPRPFPPVSFPMPPPFPPASFPMPPPFPPVSFPMPPPFPPASFPMPPPMLPPHPIHPPVKPPQQHNPVLNSQQSIEAPSVAERDPRRKHLPPGTEYMQTRRPSQQPSNRFQHAPSGPSKAPLTYLEYLRRKEINQKQYKDQDKPVNHDPEKVAKGKQNSTEKELTQSDQVDITIGMVPNKNRVAAKVYAKPAQFSTPKERYFSPAMREMSRTDSKFTTKSHNYDSASAPHKTDKKQEEPEQDKMKSASKVKDLFGEQLSQFDKMYRSGDFSKKAAPSSSGIGGFKIPKIKRVEKPSEPVVKPVEAVQHTSQRKEKSKSKSPEPPKGMVDDDGMWNTEIDKKPTETTEPSELVHGPELVAPAIDDTITSAPAATMATKIAEEGDAKQKETAIEKPQDVFHVPRLPAPRRILRRRNSVAVLYNETDMRTKTPVQAFVAPTRISRRRSSVAVSELEDDFRNAEKVEKKLSTGKKEAKEETEPEEDIVTRPRRTRMRRPVIEDDDEDTRGANTDTEPKEQQSLESEVTAEGNTVQETSMVPAKEDSSDNVVSSTTSDNTAKKRKRGRKKKESATVTGKGDVSSDASHDRSTDVELPDEASSRADNHAPKNEKPVDIQEDPRTSEAAREAKEERENKEMVEGLSEGSTSSNDEAKLVEMLRKILDEKKLIKVKEIIENPSDKPIARESVELPAEPAVTENPKTAVSEVSRERMASTSISSMIEACEKENTAAKRPARKSELDRLNEDIAGMYIRDGVLSATGRRSCTERHFSKVSPVKRAGLRKSSSAPVVQNLRKGTEFELAEKVHLKRLGVTVQNNNLSKLDLPVKRKPKTAADKRATIYESEDDLTSIASSGTSLSPRSKKKKRGSKASSMVPKRTKNSETKQGPSSYSKTYAPKPVTKNVNKGLHCQSDKAKDCALCSYVGPLSDIVQHYVRDHPLREVYVSRIPNDVAVKLKKEPLLVTGTLSDQNITFKCIFCQEVLCENKYNWKQHLASHTGEYRYKCNNCTIRSLIPSTSAHDRKCVDPAMAVTNDVIFNDNHIYGYMCRLCNYVKLSRPKVAAHIKKEHYRIRSDKGILRFSILNYEETLESKSNDTLESDISMPELTPQVPVPSQTNMSAFISSASDEIESLTVLNDSNFVSPSKPSIIDKLKENFDEIMRKDAEKAKGDDDEREDIESPPKEAQPQKVAPERVEKAKRSLAGSEALCDDIPMPKPLDMKKENVDIFEHKQLVSNIGYSKTGEKIWYLCSIGDCKYATQTRSEMYSHVEEHHGSIVWDGFCYLCTAQVLNEESSVLAKEVKHMAVIHIKDRSAFDELNEPLQAGSSSNLIEDHPMLKLRRFSGDKLSIGTAEDSIILKPWLQLPAVKNRAHCVNMLEQKSLFCFYKCMGESCCFTTTIETQMEKHVDNHELVRDISGNETPKSWLECAYCDVIAEGKIDLLHHLKLVHTGSAYQCAYCFYRSREAYNVVVHQKLHHEKEKTTVLVYEADKRPLTPADYERLNRRTIDNIKQLICPVCNAKYCVLDAYIVHLKDDHADVTTIVCQCCKESVHKLKILRHLLQHNIGIYECIYCQYGSNTMEAVQVHVCNLHPQEPPFCCIRYNKTPGKVKEASLKSLYEMSVEEDALVYCSFQPEELNYKSPDIKSNHDINFTAMSAVTPLQLPSIRIGDANILLSAHIPSSSTEASNQSISVTAKTAKTIKMPMKSSVSGGVSLSATSTVPMRLLTSGDASLSATSTVPVITAVQENDQRPTTMVMPVISHVVEGANVSNMPVLTRASVITNVCSIGPLNHQVQAPKEDDAVMLEAERIAMEMIKDTGLPKNVIYKCVFEGCNSVLPDGTGMRKHLSFSHLQPASYMCSHCKCKPSFENVMYFIQHLKTHEAQRIFCFMCDYKSSFPSEVVKHLNDDHKTSNPTILFLNPKKNDPNNDIMLFAPGIPTEAERKAYYRKLIDLYYHKLQAALIHLKTHYAPEECESLPKQAILSRTVFCSKCQYSTNVGLNMYGHLKGHLNDMPVSNMDPTNPVPCWGQGEKHFDRMRDPAASSQENDDLIQSLCFVQENNRFICGAPDCRYLTINEAMLKNHLSILHMDVKEYKCPHCPAVHIFSGQLNVGKVLEHLKLHDKELYCCSKCSIFMNIKKELEQHVDEKHNAQNAAIYVIRDGSTAGSAASTGIAEDWVVFKWNCDVCMFKSPTIGEMRSHMQEAHNITAKYRCSRCLYSCSNKSLFTIHFENQHPGCEIVIISLYTAIEDDDSRADTTPLWRRETGKTRSIRGILVEDEDEPNSADMAALSAEPQPGSSGLNMPKKHRSTESDESEISPKRAKEAGFTETAVRAFKCGFKGCNFENDYGAGIVSHFRTAHPLEKPSVLRNALANPEQSRFDYFMKYACFYCVKKADTIQDLVMHWQQIHKMAGRCSQDKPFLFRASKIILCFYCRKGVVMSEVKSHFTSQHPGNQPIYLDFRNSKRCAECDFVMGVDRQEMVHHFAAEHKNENEYAKGWIDFLTDDVVDKILQLNSVAYRCEKCDFSANNKTDFTIHYATKHPGLRVEYNEYEMDKMITYYCAFDNCQSSWNSPEDLAQHIRYHIPLFKCMCDTVECSAQFWSFAMLLEHYITTHPQHPLQYALKTPEEYKAVLRSINIQFWNGFVMTLDEARRTGNRYGSHDYFFKYIDELCAQSVAAVIATPSVSN